jgi:hypothetical protein
MRMGPALPHSREKILAKNETTTYRNNLFAAILRVERGFATSRPGQASDGSPRSRSGNFAMLAAQHQTAAT